MNFRTDINGLRTYAVLAVIIFHFNRSWLPGGFAGVDVFFVISGFLMTSIIFRGLESNSLSLLKFYAARVRRIVPALMVLIIALTIFGYFFLGPTPYKELTKHSAGSLLFISNILYWKESGYFDATALEKFLLHTWSLSVEWQFYIIYPVVLIALSKIFSLETLKKFLLIITIIVCGYAIYASYHWTVASYFLLPTRMWEMLLGGIAYIYPLKLVKQWHKHSLEIFGLFLIILSYFIASENIPWPGYMALLPTIGAFILIQANNQHSLFTNNWLCLQLGLWSYSLYLWHWPILVINNIFKVELQFWLFLIITLTLSIISYYLIEIRRWAVSKIIYSFLIVLVIVISVYRTDGVAYRTEYTITKNSNLASILGHHIKKDDELIMNWDSLVLNERKDQNVDTILFGDSFAAHYTYGITDSKNLPAVSLQWHASCLNLPEYASQAVFDWQDQAWRDKCLNHEIQLNKIGERVPIIIAQSWTGYIDRLQCKTGDCPINSSDFYAILENQLNKLILRYNAENIVIIGPLPIPDDKLLGCYANNMKSCLSTYNNTDKNILKMNKFLQEFATKHNVYYVDIIDGFLCQDDHCLASLEGYSLYYKDGHLSAFGSSYVWQYIEKMLIDKQLLKFDK